MATYKFSTPPADITSGITTTFPASGTNSFTTNDFFVFDSETITASAAVITVTSDTKIAIGGKEFIFTGFAPEKISTTNFTFADGSKLIIGDSSTSPSPDASANTLVGTDFNDYIDGRGGSDTISYASATSAVTVALSSAADTAGTVSGGGGADKLLNIENIIGSAYNDTLTGVAAGSTLDGGLGIDNLTGGIGDDTYIVTAGDTIATETGGTDTVKSSVDYALVDTGLENLTLLGSALVGIGNASNNTITGTGANNLLDAGSAGTDALLGGDGNDTYIVSHAGVTITETNNAATQIDTVISSVVGTTALTSNVENLRLIGLASVGTGNDLNNIIYANTVANTIDGGAGTDTLSYQFGATSGVTLTLNGDTEVTASGGSGADKVKKIENLIGSNYSDALTGDTNRNVLTGGLGNDTLTAGASTNDTLDGGIGNDTYIVNGASSYTIIDISGSDTISSNTDVSIASFTTIENVTTTGSAAVTGTGNSLANTMTGSSSGIDSLAGGTGNDIYIISETQDKVVEGSNAGTDTVQASVTYTLATTDNVENLTLTGSSAIDGTGNTLANIITGNSGNNTLTGGDGNDKLDGGAGNDKLDGGLGNDNMIGGAGNDTYVVVVAGDTVSEAIGTGVTDTDKANATGIDTVQSSITYTLGTALEKLELGTGNINGTGNTVDNTITGNTGKNILTGNAGNDTLNGAAGNDTLLGGAGADSIDGGTANDVITGGAGKDTVVTGTGRDTIIFATGVTDTVSTATSIAGVDLYSDLNLDADNGDLIDLTVTVATVGTLVTGSLDEATFVTDMNALLNVGGGAGFDTATTGDIAAAIVTANAGTLDTQSFLAVDLDKSGTFTATDFVIELTGTSVLTPTIDSFI